MFILIVDDHEIILESLKRTLEKSSSVSRCEVCKNSIQMWEIMEKMEPDIILLDINLGTEYGFDIAKDIKNKYPKQKIVFLTGYDLQNYQSKAKSIGASGFIDKSISTVELIVKLEEIMGSNLDDCCNKTIGLLTNRQMDILILLAKGKTQKEMARDMDCSSRTISKHVETLFIKLDVNNSAEAVAKGFELGLLDMFIH
jgi:Response regulator containing a CheY-like receiver domain and an HTH DNA-binding domain